MPHQVYQNIELGLPLSKVAAFLNEVLGFSFCHNVPHKFKGKAAAFYKDTYKRLVSICETCRFRRVSFLDFLRSGEKDIDAFAGSQRGRRKRS